LQADKWQWAIGMLYLRENLMEKWMPAGPNAEAIEALAQAMLRTGYIPSSITDEFHVRVTAEVLTRELRALGYAIKPLSEDNSAV
jgi:hypothetical protein